MGKARTTIRANQKNRGLRPYASRKSRHRVSLQGKLCQASVQDFQILPGLFIAHFKREVLHMSRLKQLSLGHLFFAFAFAAIYTAYGLWLFGTKPAIPDYAIIVQAGGSNNLCRLVSDRPVRRLENCAPRVEISCLAEGSLCLRGLLHFPPSITNFSPWLIVGSQWR